MTSRDFCYWLQGVFEVGGATSLDEKQTAIVAQHLALVFKHEIDPSMGGPKHQQELNKIHHGTTVSPGLPDGTLLRC
jgi:hypothetical protein